jgi:hypothetical protein
MIPKYLLRRTSVSLLTAASLLIAPAACNPKPQAAATGTDDRALSLVENVPAHDAHASTSDLALVPSQDQVRADIFYLASDRLEGRGVGTQGLDLAADYVATRFEALGLKPLPALGGYFQPFDMTVTETIGGETTLSSADKTYKLDDQFTALKMSAEKSFSGPVVFAGYGITNEGYDDYKGIDAKGKVVLAMRFEPHDPASGASRWAPKGEQWSTHAHLETKAKNAAAHGAIALVLINPPLYHDHGDDPLLTFDRSGGVEATLPVLHLKRAIADPWHKTAGLANLRDLQQRIDKDTRPASAELTGVSLHGKVTVRRTKRPVKNVLAYLPGSGASADEYVIVGAHYDHLGFGGRGSLDLPMLQRIPGVTEPADPKNPHAAAPATAPATAPTTAPTSQPTSRRSIHHGADDNASGTAAMLELARILSHRAKQGDKPARTIIFAAFTAEESGLVGSAHFVKNPPIDLKQVVAMLNLDMVGRVRADLLYVGGAGTAEPFQKMMDAIDRGSPLEFKDFGKGGLGPSDHMSFALKKVPVIFLFSGTHMDYHRPTDTAEKINYVGIARVVDVAQSVAYAMARMPRSKYVDAADRSSMMNPFSSGPGPGAERRASLGVIPHYGGDDEDGHGVKIAGATGGTPADKAGLKEGDILLQLGDQPTGTLVELSQALAAHKPGDKVTLKYKRGDKVITTEVTLGERRG